MLLSLLSRRTLEGDSRDSYGFAVRPQHLQRYREYWQIYKQEEEERSEKWDILLEQCSASAKRSAPSAENLKTSIDGTSGNSEGSGENLGEGNDSSSENSSSGKSTEGRHEKEVPVAKEASRGKIKTWALLRPSLQLIEKLMSARVKKNLLLHKDNTKVASQKSYVNRNKLPPNSSRKEGRSSRFQAKVDFPLKEELESLVHGGVPKSLRGEVWQAFIGVRTRRVERYYQELLSAEEDLGIDNKNVSGAGGNETNAPLPEKLRKQIEKDLTRTFPGHPALDEEGRNSLRRILTAYALHNPSVGYCQAMNFFAGLFLLLMPEENAFWSLVGIIDEYFNGYYTQEMIESQVDQLVFEELMRERFPKLVNHFDFLGVEVAWVSGPWFLSIFVNMLPWESVLRVWDVILYEGNRVMLFRTALALMELYGPALVTTQDAGDAVTLLQSLTGSTFDSSQLVLTACMGFLAVTETKLEELRNKHRPSVLVIIEEITKGNKVSKESKCLASKLYSFKHDGPSRDELLCGKHIDPTMSSAEASVDNFDDFICSLNIDTEFDSVTDLQEQVVYLKVELCRLMEEKRLATLRAEELETAFLEMVKEDNRRQLTARVEQLEQESSKLWQALADKQEQEHAMLEVLMRVDQEQKVADDARIDAENEAAVQKQAFSELQAKYDKAMASAAELGKRVVMAESMLEATLQYENGQAKASSSPRSMRSDSMRMGKKASALSFGLAWREKSKQRVRAELSQGSSFRKTSRGDKKPTKIKEYKENQQTEDVAETSREQNENNDQHEK